MKRFAFFLMCGLIISGCASSPPPPPHTIDLADQRVPSPLANKAQIVFIQPFKPIGGYIQSTALYDLKDTKKEFLGIVTTEGKVVVNVDPGQHLFMSTGFGVNFLQANVEAGKRYYVLSRFIAYVGYQLRPIRNGAVSNFNTRMPEFQEWLKACRIVETTPAGLSWVAANQAAFDKAQASAWETYQRKSADEFAQLTLNPEDAIAQ